MTSRRDFIKASAASAALIGIPMATIANPESIEDNQKDFYAVLNILMENIAALMEKSRGRFSPKTGSQGYIAWPKSKVAMLDVKNQYGISVWKFCRMCWPNLQITDSHDIDVVYENNIWVEKRLSDLGDDVGAIIDCERYGGPWAGEDSFVTFEI